MMEWLYRNARAPKRHYPKRSLHRTDPTETPFTEPSCTENTLTSHCGDFGQPEDTERREGDPLEPERTNHDSGYLRNVYTEHRRERIVARVKALKEACGRDDDTSFVDGVKYEEVRMR